MSARDSRGRVVKADPVYPGDPALESVMRRVSNFAVYALAAVGVVVVVIIAGLVMHHG